MASRSPASTAACTASRQRRLLHVDDDGRRRRPASVAASLSSARPSGPAASAPGSAIAARPAASRAKPSGGVRRNGRVNSRGTPTWITPSSIAEVDQLVDVRRQPAQRRHLEVVDQLRLADTGSARPPRPRHLAPLHQPRQHDQEPPQPLLRRAGPAPGRGGGRHRRPRRPGAASPTRRPRPRATPRRRRAPRAAPAPSASSSRPSTHERKAPRLRARHPHDDAAVGPALAHRVLADLARHLAGPDGVDLDQRLGRRRRRRAALGSSGRACGQVEVGRHREGAGGAGRHVALDAVDAERRAARRCRDRARRRTRTRRG